MSYKINNKLKLNGFEKDFLNRILTGQSLIPAINKWDHMTLNRFYTANGQNHYSRKEAANRTRKRSFSAIYLTKY